MRFQISATNGAHRDPIIDVVPIMVIVIIAAARLVVIVDWLKNIALFIYYTISDKVKT